MIPKINERISLSLIKLIFLFSVLACTKTTTNSSGKVSSSSSNGSGVKTTVGTGTSTSTSTSRVKPLEKVDSKNLRVLNLSVGKMVEDGKRGELISYALAGAADYVSWTICPEEETTQTCTRTDTQACSIGGACVQNVTPYNKVLIPNMFAGKILISLQACVEPEKALDPSKLCGQVESMEYNSHYTDLETATLFQRRQNLISSINAKGVEKKKAYVDYQNDLLDCIKNNAAVEALLRSKIAVIEQIIKGVFFKMFAWAPVKVAQEMQKTQAGSALIAGATNTVNYGVDKLTEAKDKVCSLSDSTMVDQSCMQDLKDKNSTMSDSEKAKFCLSVQPGVVQNICGMIGTMAHGALDMLKMMNPMQSIAILSDAIHTLSDPEHSVSRACLADEKFSKISQTIDGEVSLSGEQLIDVDNQLISKGEL